MKVIQYFVENGNYKILSVEKAKCLKGKLVNPIWVKIKKYLIDKWNNVNLNKETIIRAEYEFQFLLDLYDYFKNGNKEIGLTCFIKDKEVEKLSFEDYVKLLNAPTEEIEFEMEKI